MRGVTDPPSSKSYSGLLERVRDCIAGKDIIEWANDDFEPFLAQFPVTRLESGDTTSMEDGSIYIHSLSGMVRMHAEVSTRHVLITHLNENWGGFSTPIPDRTGDWGKWELHLKQAGCTQQMVEEYLDDPKVRAVVTTQHSAFCHPKIFYIPIGVKYGQLLRERIATARGSKTRDLLVNNSDWKHRKSINAAVIDNFDGQISNEYGASQKAYYESILESRFVLCPPGLGWDSYRIWETLLLGSIPVVEHSPGWHSVLDDLPVLTVNNFDQVNPALLASAYPRILSRCDRFDFNKLTKQWWVNRINCLAGIDSGLG